MTLPQIPQHLDTFNRRACILGFLLALILGVVLCTRPINDGDLFWHMAYGKQMIAHKTLILDHTLYSWTPTDNRTIYCAWASEILFYTLGNKVGIWSIFALRYTLVLGCLLFLWSYLRRRGIADQPYVWVALILWILTSSGGFQTKPEIFSFVFFNLLVLIYFHARLKKLDGESTTWTFYFIPLLLALWVNVHGGFILALPLLVIVAAGEWIIFRFCPAEALSRNSLLHLTTASVLAFAVLSFNPYGVHYPLQLFGDYVLQQNPRPDIEWNDAHISILSEKAQNGGRFILYMLLMGAILIRCGIKAALARKLTSGISILLILLNIFYLFLFCLYARTLFYWPAVFLFTVTYFTYAHSKNKKAPVDNNPKEKRSRLWVALGLCLLLVGEGVHEQIRHPSYGSWFGLGIGYINPIEETEFLRSHQLGDHFYNIFDSGGYLLWRLYPDYKVMTDSRSFPYLSWFKDQYDFSTGLMFRSFLDKYPADIAVIDLKNEGTWKHFLRASDWQVLFYGSTAVIFGKKAKLSQETKFNASPERFDELRNAYCGYLIFRFAVISADFQTAWKILERIDKKLSYQLNPKFLAQMHDYRKAYQLLGHHDYTGAQTLFARLLSERTWGDREKLINSLLLGRKVLLSQNKYDEAQKVETGLDRLAAPEG